MYDHRIDKALRKVSFQLSDGDQIDGEIFLNLYGPNHSGSEKLGDLLNQGKQFIPVKTSGIIVLLNTNHIVQAKIDAEQEEDDLMQLGKGHSVWIKTILKEEITGLVFIGLQDGHARVNDYFNETIRFLRLFQTDYIVYVNQKAVLSVHD